MTCFENSKEAQRVSESRLFRAHRNASINPSGAHPPRATVRHLLTLSVPGVGHSQFCRGPGGWALAYPGASSGHLTHVFSKDR